MEALRIIQGQRDYDQTGRGRKRVLYAIEGDFGDIFNLGVMSLMDRLGAMMKDIQSIEDLRSGREDALEPMLKDIRKVIQNRIDSIETVASAKVTL